MSSELRQAAADSMADDLDDIVAGSPEDVATDVAGAAVAPVWDWRNRCTAALALYTVDLTAQAREASWTRSSAATTTVRPGRSIS